MAINRSALLCCAIPLVLAACSKPGGEIPSPGRPYSVWRGNYNGVAQRKTRFPLNFIRAASFREVDLTSSVFRQLSVFDSSIENSVLTEVDLTGSVFRSVIIRRSRMDRADFRGVTLQEVAFINSSLVDANFANALLLFVSFENSDLSGAHFENANVYGCEFRGAKFDSQSRLPFSAEDAIKRGMVRVNL